MPVYLLRWNRCPLHVIEVLSKHRLRDFFSINDGDVLTISIKSDYVSDLALSKRIAWFALWKKREYMYYSSDYYYNILRRHKGLSFFSHIPCSAQCSKSHGIGRMRSMIIEDYDYELYDYIRRGLTGYEYIMGKKLSFY